MRKIRVATGVGHVAVANQGLSAIAGALKQTMCHRRKLNVRGASRKSVAKIRLDAADALSGRVKKGTIVPRVKLDCGARRVFTRRISKLMERV